MLNGSNMEYVGHNIWNIICSITNTQTYVCMHIDVWKFTFTFHFFFLKFYHNH